MDIEAVGEPVVGQDRAELLIGRLQSMNLYDDRFATAIRDANPEIWTLVDRLAGAISDGFDPGGSTTTGIAAERAPTGSSDNRSDVDRSGRPVESWDRPRADDRDLQGLGRDYLHLDAAALELSRLRSDEVAASAAVLADLARSVRMTAPMLRGAFEESIRAALVEQGLPHFERVVRGLEATGVLDALTAEEGLALRRVQFGHLPEIDKHVLRRAGYDDPDVVLRQGLVTARRLLERNSVAGIRQVVQDGRDAFEDLGGRPRPARRSSVPVAEPGGSRASWWTGWGKVLAGAATAGSNVVGGVAATIATGGVATGVTAAGVLASAGTGIGMIFEGVGALKELRQPPSRSSTRSSGVSA